MRHRIALNFGANVFQRTAVIGTGTTHVQLPNVGEQLANVLLRYNLINIRQMVEQALHLLLKGIIQAGFKVAGAAWQLCAVHENVSFREGLL